MMTPGSDFPACLHTVLVTDGRGDIQRLDGLLDAALAGGIRAVQLREPTLKAPALAELCGRWKPRFDAVGAILLVNDSAEPALAGRAHGVHLKQGSTVSSTVAGAPLWIGRSVHDASEIAAASAADYLHLAPLFATECKPGAAALGPDAARKLLELTTQPVVLLGGIGLHNVEEARRIGGVGVAVMSAICSARDPEYAVRELVASRGAALVLESEADNS